MTKKRQFSAIASLPVTKAKKMRKLNTETTETILEGKLRAS